MKILLFIYLIISSTNVYAECLNNSSKIRKLGELDRVLDCFNQEIKNLKTENIKLNTVINSSSSKLSVINTLKELPAPKVGMSKTESNFKFDLIECNRMSDIVSCSFQITNRGEDVDIWFNQKTRAFDEFGNEYKPSSANIADKSADLSQTKEFKKYLISKVPTSAKIEFSGVIPKATQFTALNIVSYRSKYFTVKLRNISIN